jgi:hypothetical protein
MWRNIYTLKSQPCPTFACINLQRTYIAAVLLFSPAVYRGNYLLSGTCDTSVIKTENRNRAIGGAATILRHRIKRFIRPNKYSAREPTTASQQNSRTVATIEYTCHRFSLANPASSVKALTSTTPLPMGVPTNIYVRAFTFVPHSNLARSRRICVMLGFPSARPVNHFFFFLSNCGEVDSSSLEVLGDGLHFHLHRKPNLRSIKYIHVSQVLFRESDHHSLLGPISLIQPPLPPI